MCRVASGVGAVGFPVWQTPFWSENVEDAEAARAHGCLGRQLSSWPEGTVCALGLSLLLSANLDEIVGAVRSISGRVECNLLALARPAVMVGGVASVGDRSLSLPALRTPAHIRAPPRLRPPLP